MKTVTLQGGHFRARLAQQRFATRLFIPSALGFVLLLLSSVAVAQPQLSRFELMASVRAAQRSLDLPLFREHAMALLARAQARGLLAESGKKLQLAAGWLPGNAHWDRAEAILVRERTRSIDTSLAALTDRDRDTTDALKRLSDAQLAEVLAFYQSERFRRLVGEVDARLTRWVFLSTQTDIEESLERRMAALEAARPSTEDLRQLDIASGSPAFQMIAAEPTVRLIQLSSDPYLLTRGKITPIVILHIRVIMNEFQAANGAPTR